MSIRTGEIQIQARDGGQFSAYIAKPAQDHAPALIMIQEIFGVNAEMRRKCDEMAEAGFTAICPDLFWRLEKGVQLSDQSKAEWDKAFDLMTRFDQERGIEDLCATLDHARMIEGAAKVGCIGFCLGGRLAWMLATRSDIDCAVSYYGVGLEGLMKERMNLTHPIMLHIAEKDRFVPKDAQAIIQKSLSDHALATVHFYEGVDHAFARQGGEHYDKETAASANDRTMNFLRSHL